MTSSLAADFRSRLISDYLAALSSGAPAPGGGSAAGLAGALGCALGSMVCNVTLAQGESEELSTLRDTFDEMREVLLRLAEEDERVFGAYRKAAAMPRSSDAEKIARRAAIESSLVEAADVPVRMIAIGLDAIASLRLSALAGSPHVIGDLLTGGFLLQAMVLGSLENVDANVSLMKSAENRARFSSAAMSARADLDTAMSQLDAAVAGRRA
jgi:formiminotetrahydrofolate cyclodeaminase